MPLPDKNHPTTLATKAKRLLVGNPKDFHDQSIFHKITLIPFLAWVGLGADGLSSSSYGPEEAFKAFGGHSYLAVALAVVMAGTVFIISAAYRKIIEAFPHGGGGYVVASHLLGHRAGVISGCALLVDYALTITTSVAAAGDAIFSMLPAPWIHIKVATEICIILFLTILNFRGVRESVQILAPIFMVFLITHIAGIVGGIAFHAPEIQHTAQTVHEGFVSGLNTMGIGAMCLLFIHAYSLGGGTFTGIEAVSNGLPIMREPKVQTAKITMWYMAISLAFTAAGLLICYLLWGVNPVEGKTMNAVLFEKLGEQFPGGGVFVILSLFSEGLLLVVAAQAGFIDGPRVLANMAIDSWFPRRFAALSDRLTTGNGVILMGVASLAALLYTAGKVDKLVVMYSINVFLTFSLSIFGMLSLNIKEKNRPKRFSSIILFSVGFLLCATILCITVFEKFAEGGWITLLVTAALVFLCFTIKGHYLVLAKKLRHLQLDVSDLPRNATPNIELDKSAKTATILVAGYGGLGLQTLRNILNTFPGLYKNFIFISVGVVDSGGFKGEDAIAELEVSTETMLKKYVTLARQLGYGSTYRFSVGTDIILEAELLCEKLSLDFPNITFFTGKVIFAEENWYHRLLHNETAFTLQKRLQKFGLTMVILPARVT